MNIETIQAYTSTSASGTTTYYIVPVVLYAYVLSLLLTSILLVLAYKYFRINK